MNNPLQCEDVGWGELSQLRSHPAAKNEVAIFLAIAGSIPFLTGS